MCAGCHPATTLRINKKHQSCRAHHTTTTTTTLQARLLSRSAPLLAAAAPLALPPPALLPPARPPRAAVFSPPAASFTVRVTVDTPSTNLVLKITFALLNMPSFSDTTMNWLCSQQGVGVVDARSKGVGGGVSKGGRM